MCASIKTADAYADLVEQYKQQAEDLKFEKAELMRELTKLQEPLVAEMVRAENLHAQPQPV